jgi:hypothetical protein
MEIAGTYLHLLPQEEKRFLHTENHYTALGSSILSMTPGFDYNTELKVLVHIALSLSFEVAPNLMARI